MQEPDPGVVRAAAAGDLDAFEVLVRAYQEPIWRFLHGMVSDAALAEDLTQETFLRAFDRLATFRFEAKLSTWLFQIARNRAVDALRVRERRDRLPSRLGPLDTPPGAELRVELEAALAALSGKLRETLLVVEVMGFTCREAADILRIPEGTVKSRLFHARARLIAWYDAHEGSDGTRRERADEV